MNIKLIIEYDGTDYVGWQRQLNGPSIQQAIEEAIAKITGEKVNTMGAGRTDSGVHARGQVANFLTNASMPPERFSYALNSMLPKDIKVMQSEEVHPDFHARYSAKGKKYKYGMVVSPHGTALLNRYYYHIRAPLNIDLMKAACECLVGTHDFSTFQSAGASVKSTVRTIYTAQLDWQPPYLYFLIEGNGFLYNMVRIIVGTLIKVGNGKIAPEKIIDIMESKDRHFAGPTAPAHGLFLEEVYY